MDQVLMTVSLVLAALGGILLDWLLPTPQKKKTPLILFGALFCFVIAAFTAQPLIQSDVPIEKLGTTAIPYGAFVAFDDKIAKRYIISYSIPDEPPTAAEFVLVFSEPQDFSKYQYLRLTFIRQDNDTKIDFTIRDEGYVDKYCSGNLTNCPDIHTLPLGVDSPTYNQYHWFRPSEKEFVYTIPLDRFANLNIQAITQIGFNAQTHLSPGDHTFTIEGITLLPDRNW